MLTASSVNAIIKTTKGKTTQRRKEMTIATLEIITAIVTPIVSLSGIFAGAKLNKPMMVIGNVALAILTAGILRAI